MRETYYMEFNHDSIVDVFHFLDATGRCPECPYLLHEARCGGFGTSGSDAGVGPRWMRLLHGRLVFVLQ
jgi:hypothetical protein